MPGSPARPEPNRWGVLSLPAVAQLMVVLDVTIRRHKRQTRRKDIFSNNNPFQLGPVQGVNTESATEEENRGRFAGDSEERSPDVLAVFRERSRSTHHNP
jgi:hypothetical protein